jgi:hypothetical protein
MYLCLSLCATVALKKKKVHTRTHARIAAQVFTAETYVWLNL